MPHFIIECSENVLKQKAPQEIIQAVYDTALATELFATNGPGGIKVRINPYRYYNTVNSQKDFIHVFGNIMEGRTEEQKKRLSKNIVSALTQLLPETPVISMNVDEFKQSNYCNKTMLT